MPIALFTRNHGPPLSLPSAKDPLHRDEPPMRDPVERHA
jgi:hypothetical protein